MGLVARLPGVSDTTTRLIMRVLIADQERGTQSCGIRKDLDHRVVVPTMAEWDFKIEVYERGVAVCREWDPRAVEVARFVAGILEPLMSGLRVEHFGSTAVPGCDGKGVVDLAVVYPVGELAAARELVDSLGFQRQRTPDPFPEERPMRVGGLRHAGRLYQVHIHVLSEAADEVAELLEFRDRLRSDAALREAYIARKREIIEGGVSDPLEYCYAKGEFIDECLGRRGDNGGKP